MITLLSSISGDHCTAHLTATKPTLLSTLRLAPETLHTPVIICSADGQFLVDKNAQLLAHGVETLEKPFQIEELLEKITRTLKPEDQAP